MQIFRCDVCKTIGEPGMQWVRVNLYPFTIAPTNQPCEEPSSYENLYMDACSIHCIRQRLIDFDFVVISIPTKLEMEAPVAW